MSWRKPAPSVVWQAIETYLKHAYPGPPPSAVRARLETLRSTAEPDFFDCPVFERPAAEAAPARYCLRLGNRFYPHMKMLVERSPDRTGSLFRADTHDTHCQPPPGSREHAAFAALVEQNRQIAADIEHAWEGAGLPTFRSYLKDDLAKRKAKA